MIPWFIVTAIDAVTSRLGFDMTVECRSDRRWAVEGFWLKRRPAGQPRPAKLGPYRGGEVQPGRMLTEDDAINEAIASALADGRLVGPRQ